MICILGLLLLSIEVFAQPVEGPWVIAEATGNSSFTQPKLCARNAFPVVDFFFVESDTSIGRPVRHGAASFTDGEVMITAHSLPMTAGWRKKVGAVHSRGADGWIAVMYENSALYWEEGGENRTYLFEGSDDATPGDTLNEGYMSYYMPGSGDEFSSDFNLKPREGGGWMINWVRNGAWSNGQWSEPDNSVSIVLLDSSLAIEHRWLNRDPVQGGMAELRAHIAPWVDDSLIAFFIPYVTNYLLHLFPEIEYPDAVLTTVNLHPLAFERVSEDNLLALSAAIQGEHTTPFAARVDWDGTCTFLGDVEMPSLDAIGFHPNYGFAILHASASSLQLARVDTNGTQFLPTGTLAWRDSLHRFSEANLTITDEGLIVTVWTEIEEGDTAARRVMLATVGWDTPLSVGRQPEAAANVTHFSLSAYPNPFNAEVRITYDLPQRTEVELAIYNLLGERVAVLKSGAEEAGRHTVQWKPEVSSGIYFARLFTPPLAPPLKQGGNIILRKIVYLR